MVHFKVGLKIQWLNPIKDICLVLLLELIVNWSYYKKVPAFDISEKSDVYFKSHWHKRMNYAMNIVFVIVAILVIIQWVLF